MSFDLALSTCIWHCPPPFALFASSLSSHYSALTPHPFHYLNYLKMTSISDLGQTLSTPLISNLLEREGDECGADCCDEEEGCMPCHLQIVVSNDELDEISGDASSQPSWWNGNCAAWWVALHALLFLQLGTALCMSDAEATTAAGLHWPVVIYGSVLYLGISILYHKAVKNSKLTCLLVLLAPEILINIISGLVILDQSVAAFLFMLGSILCLAILVVVISIRCLVTAGEDDCKQLHDKLDASLLKGDCTITIQIV
jgi:hypothetical protein